MKRILVLFALVLFAAGSVFADEAVLIDFSKLVPDILDGQQEQGVLPQNRQTVMDFSTNAGSSFTAEQKSVMKTSLAVENWLVKLAQSSKTVLNDSLSFTRIAKSKQHENVMGVRVHFPVANFNSYAKILPPFDIPAYEYTEVSETGDLSKPAEKPAQTRFEGGYGLVKNVGSVKAIAVDAYGLNFPCTLSAIIIDGSGIEQVVFLGPLNYDGWATLRWDNPQYIQNVRNRVYHLNPLYPIQAPYVKFGGFIIQRDAANAQIVDTDFVAYFKEVRVLFDKAELEMERDINDEDTWSIIEDRELEKAKIEGKDFGKDQVFRYLEERKHYTAGDEDKFLNPAAAQGGAGQQ
ncbi:MAG: flagellar filament outer layer protein FlaA [Spirochaetaceae bacterium]|jgi:hypothetical protein|nr:flagellar filament outer layer protein FlaA [Spirochaetaceae bacterium]